MSEDLEHDTLLPVPSASDSSCAATVSTTSWVPASVTVKAAELQAKLSRPNDERQKSQPRGCSGDDIPHFVVCMRASVGGIALWLDLFFVHYNSALGSNLAYSASELSNMFIWKAKANRAFFFASGGASGPPPPPEGCCGATAFPTTNSRWSRLGALARRLPVAD